MASFPFNVSILGFPASTILIDPIFQPTFYTQLCGIFNYKFFCMLWNFSVHQDFYSYFAFVLAFSINITCGHQFKQLKMLLEFIEQQNYCYITQTINACKTLKNKEINWCEPQKLWTIYASGIQAIKVWIYVSVSKLPQNNLVQMKKLPVLFISLSNLLLLTHQVKLGEGVFGAGRKSSLIFHIYNKSFSFLLAKLYEILMKLSIPSRFVKNFRLSVLKISIYWWPNLTLPSHKSTKSN